MKSFHRILAMGLVFASAGLALVTSTGCGNSAVAVCRAKCDCEGCSDARFRACDNEADGDEREADFRGCLDFYDDYVNCQDDTGFCDGADWETSCKPEKDRYKNCIDN